MRSIWAALRSIVLPYGRTTGTRIVLDGENGKILVYNAADVLIAEMSSAEGFWTINAGTSQVCQLVGGSLTYLNNAGKLAQWLQMYELAFSNDDGVSSTRLTYSATTENLTFTVQGTKIAANVPLHFIDTGASVSHPAIYTAGEVINETSTSNIAGTETVTDTVTFNASAGRTYEAEWSHTIAQPSGGTNPAVGDRWVTKIREDSATGTARATARHFWEGSGGIIQRAAVIRGRWTAAADGSKTIVGTLVRESGLGDARRYGDAARPSILTIRDVTAT